MSDLILQFILWVISKNPHVASVIVFVGTARLVLKPIMSGLQSAIEVTPTKIDDEWFQKLISSKWYKAITWLLDYIGSIKMPQKKQ